MHGFEEFGEAKPQALDDKTPWYRSLNSYHWFVLVVAALGWLFDCLDQQLFVLARPAAMAELVTEDSLPPVESGESESRQAKLGRLALARSKAGDLATSVFLAGWATGGLFFGMLGDRIGRAKTMMITILMYSLFTGLSSFSRGVADFAFYRFLTGLGVGGEFAVGVALVAEVMPSRARPYTLGLLQALSAVGNISAACINLGLGIAEETGLVSSPWRIMFMVGALPALLALVIRGRLKEPEQWAKASHDDGVTKQLGSYKELLGDPRWRKHALLGLILACSGVIGLWAVGFFTPDLIRMVQRRGLAVSVYQELADQAGDADRKTSLLTLRDYEADPRTAPKTLPDDLQKEKEAAEKIIRGRLTRWASYTSMMINLGAALGMFGFGALSQVIGRKPTFALGFLAAFISTSAVFLYLEHFWQIFVMVPIMGFCQLSLFAGYAIYFPELFPTRLRSTGTSFCYNVGRFVAAMGPLVKSQLEEFFKNPDNPVQSLRYAGVTMCVVFLMGLLVLPFLPETRGKPLPE